MFWACWLFLDCCCWDITCSAVKRKNGQCTGLSMHCPNKNRKELSSFYFSASQARSTNINLLSVITSIYFTSYGFNVRFPHSVGSSMWMADIFSEMCTFSTNAAFCHNCTSLQLTKPTRFKPQAHNMNILPERILYCKWKMIFLQKRKYLFLFFGKKGIILGMRRDPRSGRSPDATYRFQRSKSKLGRVLRSPIGFKEVNRSGRMP